MDFLTRLVQRQRNDRIGVRPVLPSRFETKAKLPFDVETVGRSRDPEQIADDDRLGPALPRPIGVGETVSLAPKPTAPRPHQPASPHRQPAPTPPPEQQLALMEPPALLPRLLPPRGAQQTTDRHRTAAPINDVLTEPVPPHTVSTTLSGSVPTPVDTPAPPELPHQLVSSDRYHTRPTIPSLMRRDTAAEPVTIAINIGRVELQPPSAPPHGPQSPAATPTATQQAYQPRLTLEDYLALPNRGRR